jgi:hypothetical protein
MFIFICGLITLAVVLFALVWLTSSFFQKSQQYHRECLDFDLEE